MRICREASPDAARRMVALMDSEDPRVAYMATNAVLERAWGKPREYDPSRDGESKTNIVEAMSKLSPEQRNQLRDALDTVRALTAALPAEPEGGQN